MQTLISVFEDRADARKAMDRLVKLGGFSRDDVHMHEAGESRAVADEEGLRELADHTMGSAEREIAMDRGVLDSLGHFFVSLFGQDRGEKAAGEYGTHVSNGRSVVLVDARTDDDAEAAAVILHECGAIDVDDHDAHTTASGHAHPGVRMYEREAPSLGDVAAQRHLREESLLATRAGQITKELREERKERAIASAMNSTDRDRPK